MRKNKWSIACILVLAISLILPVSALAAASTGTIALNCTQVQFTGAVATGEQVKLIVQLHSGPTWYFDPLIQDYSNIITAVGAYDVTVPWVQNPNGLAYRVVIQVSTDGGSSWANIALSEDRLTCVTYTGCTPGFWRNHTEDWVGYSPSDIFDFVFGVNHFGSTYTLYNAIWQGGGGWGVIARHGTAALLSAANPNVNYPYTVAEVIAMVQAGDIDPLVAANNLGCSVP